MGDDLSTNYVGTGIPPRSTSAPPAARGPRWFAKPGHSHADWWLCIEQTRNFQTLAKWKPWLPWPIEMSMIYLFLDLA